MKVFAVLMAGGVGTRFWPRSRRKTPKQVLDIIDHETLIQATFKRLRGLVPVSRIFMVTNAAQKVVISQQLPRLKKENYIIEPFGRNTAPCIGLAASIIQQIDANAGMVVLPADHLISDVKEFQQVIKQAVKYAEETESLVTLGISPTFPASGYGYIQMGSKVKSFNGHSIFKVKTFAEKPNRETAMRFLESGDFLWNSGMFIWKASTILKEIEDKLPELSEGLNKIKKHFNKADLINVIEDVYLRIRDISIDYGVMQTAQHVCVIPTNMGWNDVGSWEVVYDISEKDKNKNAGDFRQLNQFESSDNYIFAPDKLVALVGIKNLIVVDTGDVLLICRKNRSQDVKEIVEQLKKSGLDEYL
jgi:mannose-1-phosphate guanylyltransferase